MAKLMHLFFSRNIFCLSLSTIPLRPALLQSFKVSKPIVGKSTLKSCFFFGYLIKTPLLIFILFIFLIKFLVPFEVSLKIEFPLTIIA